MGDSKFQHDMGPQGGMAQISPWKFMDALCQEVKNLGGEAMIGRVTGVIVEEAAVKGVTLQKNGLEETVPCSALVLCMELGPGMHVCGSQTVPCPDRRFPASTRASSGMMWRWARVKRWFLSWVSTTSRSIPGPTSVTPTVALQRQSCPRTRWTSSRRGKPSRM